VAVWPGVGCDGGSEFFEEIVGGFLRRAVDEALAELGELSTDPGQRTPGWVPVNKLN
jgi:hypothetical protein